MEFSYYHARLGLETSSVRKQDLQPHVRADDRGSALRRVDQRLETLNRFHGHDNGECWTAWRYADVLSERQTDRQTDRETDRHIVTATTSQVCRGYGDPHGYGYGVGMAIEIPSLRQPCN